MHSLLLMLSTLFAGSGLVLASALIYYEVMRFTWHWLPRLNVAFRLRVLVVVIAIFGGHTIIVWMYGLFYWLLPQLTPLAEWIGGDLAHRLNGAHDGSFESALYFSASTYSSLGFGDIVPEGSMRLLSAIEVLNGLVLIGWSVSFTYLAMERYWPLHPLRKDKDR